MIYCIPHGKKTCCETFNRISCKLYSCILPVTIWMSYVKILICKIISTSKTNFSIYNSNLPVIPVIHKHIDYNLKWIKHPALYPLISHTLYEFFVQEKYTSKIIVEYSYLNSIFCFIYKNFF